MRPILKLLLALFFLLHTALVPAAGMHSCCQDRDCPITQCADMGCAPAQQPLAPMAALPAPPPPGASSAVIGRAVVALPPPVDEIWTPPD